MQTFVSDVGERTSYKNRSNKQTNKKKPDEMLSFLNVGTCDLDMGLELSFLSGVADLRPKLKISSS